MKEISKMSFNEVSQHYHVSRIDSCEAVIRDKVSGEAFRVLRQVGQLYWSKVIPVCVICEADVSIETAFDADGGGLICPDCWDVD